MHDSLIDPPDPKPEYAECPQCHDMFCIWHPAFWEINWYASWDKDEETPICSEECVADYEEENGWEHED